MKVFFAVAWPAIPADQSVQFCGYLCPFFVDRCCRALRSSADSSSDQPRLAGFLGRVPQHVNFRDCGTRAYSVVRYRSDPTPDAPPKKPATFPVGLAALLWEPQ